MKNPLVSVIIPVYNGEKTLMQCLDSVLNQTYKNYEVIVVNNNSTDKTKDIIKEFQNKNKKIRYVFEHYRSIGAARNSGINIAKGDIIISTDCDCIVPSNWIEKLTKPIINENESVVMGFEKDLIKNFWTTNLQRASWKFMKRHINGKYINILDGKNFAIKSSVIKKLMFDSKIHFFEDYEFGLRLKKIVKIRFIPEIKVGHYYNSSFTKIIKMNFMRATWITKIFNKHKKDKNIKNELMTESISLKNFLLFPLWMVIQFIQKPFGEAYFIFVSEVSWRSGIILVGLKRLIV